MQSIRAVLFFCTCHLLLFVKIHYFFYCWGTLSRGVGANVIFSLPHNPIEVKEMVKKKPQKVMVKKKVKLLMQTPPTDPRTMPAG